MGNNRRARTDRESQEGVEMQQLRTTTCLGLLEVERRWVRLDAVFSWRSPLRCIACSKRY